MTGVPEHAAPSSGSSSRRSSRGKRSGQHDSQGKLYIVIVVVLFF